MKQAFKISAVLGAVLLTGQGMAQPVTPDQIFGLTPYESPSCNLKDFHELDFMHGEWDLKVLVDGKWKPGGYSVHRPVLGGCVSFEYVSYENWGDFYQALSGRTGLAGFALNSYDKSARNWRQTWFDDTGTVINSFRGRKYSDGIRFVGHAPDGTGAELQRFDWKIVGQNLREYTFDMSTDGGQNWTRMATVQMVRRAQAAGK